MSNPKSEFPLSGHKIRKLLILVLALTSSNKQFAQNKDFESFTKKSVTASVPSKALNGQSSILDAYIQEGIKNNLQLRKEQFSVWAAYTSLKEARSLFFPELTFNAKYQFAKGGRQIDVPVGDMLNPVYNTLNNMTGTNSFPQLQNMEVPLMPNKYQETFLASSITIFNTDLYFNYRAQKKMISVRYAQMEAFTNVLKQQITNAYLEHLQALDANRIVEKNKTTVLELKRLNDKLYNAGVKTKDAIIDAEYELSLIESKISESEKNVNLTKSYFNYLLNREVDTDITVDTLISYKTYEFDVQLPNNSLVANRKELTQLSSFIDANKELVKMNKYNMFIPKVYLNTNIGYQGFKYKFNKDHFYNYQIFTLRWTLLNGGRSDYKHRQAQIALYTAQNQYEDLQHQLQLEIKKSYEEYITSKEQYKSAQKALEAAEESYRLVYKKYEQNQVLWLELIDKHNKLLSAQMQLSIAKYAVLMKETNYKKSISDL